MSDKQNPGGEIDRAQKDSEANGVNASQSMPWSEQPADNSEAEATSGDAARGPGGTENLLGAGGGEGVVASAVSHGNELNAGQAEQLAALETLFTAIVAQQKQTIDLISRALTDNANTLAALADLRRTLEQNDGRNQNDNRNGMQ